MNIFNRVIIYKLAVIPNFYVRVLAIIVLLGIGFSLMAFVIAPMVEAVLVKALKVTGHGVGVIGSTLLVLVITGGVYWTYVQLYANGPQSIIPHEWHNGEQHDESVPHLKKQIEELKRQANERFKATVKAIQ